MFRVFIILSQGDGSFDWFFSQGDAFEIKAKFFKEYGYMRRVLLSILALMMLSVMSGCGNQKENESLSLPGIWATASVGYEYYGTSQAEYYVRFVDSRIEYGHLKDDEFIPEYSDTVSLFEKTGTDRYLIKAETDKGLQYTYETCEDDTDVLQYYETWNEDDFHKMYRGGASLWKSKR